MDRSLMMKATSADENPTPGYLYGEIAKMTNRGGDVVNKICSFLIDRLNRSKDPNVKYKCLVVIKQTCRKGHQSFRRAVQAPSNISTIKMCLQFTGPPDPLKGDHPFKAVREAAKDTLETVFDNSVEVADQALASRIQGYGASDTNMSQSSYDSYSSSQYHQGARALPSESSNSYSSSSYNMGNQSNSYASNSGGGGRKYEGFGNPNFRDVRNEPKGFMDRVKDRIEEYSDVASKTVASSGIKSWLGNPSRSSNRNRPPMNSHYSSDYEYPERSSYSGPTVPTSNTQYTSTSTAQPWGSSNSATSSQQLNLTQRPASNSALSDGTYERSLVNDVCSRGGVRPVPSREKLSSFVNACRTLEPSVVMPILYEKLSSNDWKVQHKALCVCEALIESGDNESYVDYIDENAEILEDLRQSSQPTLRARCKKVWILLYGEDDTSFEETSSPPPRTNSNSNEVDLLDMGTSESTAAAPLQKSDSLLDMDEPEAQPVVQNQPKASSMFDNLSVKQASVENQSSRNMFEKMNVKSSSNESNEYVDLLGDPDVISTTDSKPPPSNLTDDLIGLSFDSPSVNDATPSASQGFAFINASPPEPPKSDPVGNVFDSLMGDSKPTSMSKGMAPLNTPNAYGNMLNPSPRIGNVGMVQNNGRTNMVPQSYQPTMPIMHSQHLKPQQLKGMSSPQPAQPDKFDFVTTEMGKMK